MCGVPHEIMTEFALQAWDKTKNPYFYLNGYTNGCLGYWPTPEEYDKGGYEVYWSMLEYYSYYGRVSPLNRDTPAELIDAAISGAPNL